MNLKWSNCSYTDRFIKIKNIYLRYGTYIYILKTTLYNNRTLVSLVFSQKTILLIFYYIEINNFYEKHQMVTN